MKPIMLIGLYGRPDQRQDLACQLLNLGLERIAYAIAREENVVHYDMAFLPERGDALDHFGEVSMVVAHHLYYDTLERSPYFYNRRNNEIVDRADAAGVPLLVVGDFPLRVRREDKKLGPGLRLYLPPSASDRSEGGLRPQ